MKYRDRIPAFIPASIKPLTVTDLDLHPDGERLWATLRALAVEMGDEVANLEEDLREASQGREPGDDDYVARRTVAERSAEGFQAGHRAGYATGFDKGFDEGRYEGAVTKP
jgi:flagellar biosynthesis/type III secretory pathway protein FliH